MGDLGPPKDVVRWGDMYLGTCPGCDLRAPLDDRMSVDGDDGT